MALLRYADLTWEEIEGLDRRKTVLVLPVGSLEQHGPHLPLDTDALSAEYFGRQLARHPDIADFIVAPAFRYTYARHSMVFPGTVSIEAETLIRLTRDVLRCYLHHRFDKILILNAHMENTDFLIEGIALALGEKNCARVVLANWWELVEEKDLKAIFGSDWRGWIDEHAALVETSLLMFMAPELVRTDKMRGGIRKSPFDFRIFPWVIESFPDSGVFSEVQGSCAGKGEKLVEIVIEALAALVQKELLGSTEPRK